MHIHQLVVAVLASTLAVATVRSQTTHGALAVSAGTATDITGARATALTVSPSVSGSGVSSVFSLTGTGTRFGNGAWSAQVGGGYTARGNAAVTPTLELGASAALTSYSFSYVTGDVTPSIEVGRGRFALAGGVHLSGASTSGSTPPGPLPYGITPRQTMPGLQRMGVTGVVAAVMNGSAETGEAYSLGVRIERGTVAGAPQTDNTLTAAIGSDRLSLNGSFGRRWTPAGATPYGSAGLTISATPTMALQFGAGRYPANAMLATPVGQFASAGVSFSLGKRPPTLPRPAGVPPIGAGMTRVSIEAADANTVDLAGDFNHWDSVPAHRASNGVWYVDLRIPPGSYRYAFRVNGTTWRTPAGVPAAEDDFGGKSAWLTVTRAGNAPTK